MAWAEERLARSHPRARGRGARSALVMQRVPHEDTLRDRLTLEQVLERLPEANFDPEFSPRFETQIVREFEGAR